MLQYDLFSSANIARIGNLIIISNWNEILPRFLNTDGVEFIPNNPVSVADSEGGGGAIGARAPLNFDRLCFCYSVSYQNASK